MAAAVAGGVEVLPRLQPGIALVLRRRVPTPLPGAGFGVEGLQVSRRVEIVARRHQDVVTDDNRGHGREVLLRELGDLDVPSLGSGARVERDEVVVRRGQEQVVTLHAEAAIAGMRPAARLPDVLPEDPSIACVNRPGVVGARGVQHAVDREHAADDARGAPAAVVQLTRPFAADDRRHRGPAATETAEAAAAANRRHAGLDARAPCQRQVLDVGAIELRERAVPLARVITGVGGPVVRQRLQQHRIVHATALAERAGGPQTETENDGTESSCGVLHFRVTR